MLSNVNLQFYIVSCLTDFLSYALCLLTLASHSIAHPIQSLLPHEKLRHLNKRPVFSTDKEGRWVLAELIK